MEVSENFVIGFVFGPKKKKSLSDFFKYLE